GHSGLAVGGNEADGGFLKHVVRRARYAEVLVAQQVVMLHLDIHEAEVEIALPAGDLGTDENGQRLALSIQTDASREKRQRILLDATETEDVCILQKERALLREEQRKAREIDAAFIDFGLREIGVHRE